LTCAVPCAADLGTVLRSARVFRLDIRSFAFDEILDRRAAGAATPHQVRKGVGNRHVLSGWDERRRVGAGKRRLEICERVDRRRRSTADGTTLRVFLV